MSASPTWTATSAASSSAACSRSRRIPNADRLRVCQVDVGEGDARQIVCGAWNFEAGATVAVALPGAYLPILDVPLDERELRGQPSRGMILAEDEVGLGDDHAGIMLLEDGLEPGRPLVDVLPIRDRVLDAIPTVNRVDLLSMVGIAREVAALLDGELHVPEVDDPAVVDEEPVDVRVEDLARCPRYIGRVFRDVNVGPSPQWLRARLYLADMRSISNVVDVTNYVMHVWGSPLHAFDRSKLAEGRIVVRRARSGEEVRTLDGVARELVSEDLVIADAERAVALAAIMGGEETEVTDETTEVLLEAANFEPLGILASSERHALRTAGSNRWEKGVDPYLADPAAKLASRLIVDLAGARMTGSTDVQGALPERPVVHLRPERASSLIGLDVPPDEQRRTLEGFGFEVSPDWDVTVPTWRVRDVAREIDLVEEVARPVLDRVPLTLPKRRHVRGRLSPSQLLRRLTEDVLVGAGLSEAYTWSLAASDPSPDAIRLPDPMTVGSGGAPDDPLAGPRQRGAHRHRRRGRLARALRDRPDLPAVGRAAAGGALAPGRDRRRRLRRGQGSPRDALRRAEARAPRRAFHPPAAAPGQDREDGGRRAGRAAPDAPRRDVGRIRARSGHPLLAGPGADRVRRRDHVPGRQPGHRGCGGRGRGGGWARRRGSRGRRAAPSRGARVRRLPRRPGRGGPQVGGDPSRLPVARADAHG